VISGSGVVFNNINGLFQCSFRFSVDYAYQLLNCEALCMMICVSLDYLN